MPPFAWYKLFNVYNLHVKYTALENTWRALGCILLNSMNRRYKQNIGVICFFNDVFSTNYTAEGNYCKIHGLHIWSRIVIKKDYQQTLFWHSTTQSTAATYAYEIHFNNTITCTQCFQWFILLRGFPLKCYTHFSSTRWVPRNPRVTRASTNSWFVVIHGRKRS